LLTSVPKTLVKEPINIHIVLKIQVFIFVLAIITPLFDANLLAIMKF